MTLTANLIGAPRPEAFAKYPMSWYYVCMSKSLPAGGLMKARLCGKDLVIFRGKQGRASALESWCPHLGSDLSLGRVVGSSIECPNHRFRFDEEGICAAQGLRAKSYAVEERFGGLFVFLASTPLFPLPSFPADINLISAKPMQWKVDTHWYMLVANPFDSRHFADTHDRRVEQVPVLHSASEFALNLDMSYEITGSSISDRLTRFISGSHVRLRIAAWGGNIILVRAAFAGDDSFGILVVEPEYHAPDSTGRGARVTVIVSAMRRSNSMLSTVLDDLKVRAKRLAIKRFLTRDAKGVERLNYVPNGLRAGDETLAQFLRWAAGLRQAEL